MERLRFPFRLKLTSIVAVLAAGPVIAVGILLIDVNADTVEVASRQLQIAIVDDVARTVEAEMLEARDGLVAVGHALTDPDLAVDVRVPAAMTLVESSDSLDAVSIYDRTGVLIDTIREGPEAGGHMPEVLPEALRMEAPGTLAVGEVDADPAGPRVLVAVTLRARNRTTGYAATRLSLAPIQERVERLTEAHLSGIGAVFVVDEQRRTVAHPDVERAHALAPARVPDVSALRSRGASSGELVDEEGRAMVGSIVPLRTVPWAVVVQVSRDSAYASLEKMRFIVVLTVATAVLLALLAALILSRRITAPIAELSSFARDLAARRFDRRIRIQTRDELALLGDAMSTAAADLEASEDQIRAEAAIRADLGRYLPAELVEKIVRREQDMELGGQRLAITVLFADVVAFTPLTVKLPAEDVVNLLNELFTVLTDVVFRHGGTVDKFIGDSIMAIWGAPTPQADHARRALAAAEDMQRWLETANPGWQDRYGVAVQLAIGVNSGEAIVGNVGSRTRMEYTAIGDVVNVAARLEAIARPQQILISQATRDAAGAGFDFVEIGERVLSGRSESVHLYEVRV